MRQWKLSSSHSNENRQVKIIKDIVYAEVYVINMRVMFQLIPLMIVEKKIIYRNITFMLPWSPINLNNLGVNRTIQETVL